MEAAEVRCGKKSLMIKSCWIWRWIVSFTLQNGAEILGRQFEQVELRNYEDALEIARIEDYLDYIYSMASLDGLERKYYAVLKSYFESKKADGYLHVPKEYGMFVAVK